MQQRGNTKLELINFAGQDQDIQQHIALESMETRLPHCSAVTTGCPPQALVPSGAACVDHAKVCNQQLRFLGR